MPQASKEQRAEWADADGIGEDKAVTFLESNGWKAVGNGVWRRPDRKITEQEWRAFGFLMDEWDHGLEPRLEVGDKVVKVGGYRYPGVVVAVFTTLSDEMRVVVECTVPDVAGMLHIYNLNQVRKVPNEAPKADPNTGWR